MKTRRIKTYLTLVSALLLGYACDKEEAQPVNEQEQTAEVEYFVSLYEAEELVANLQFEKSLSPGQGKGNIPDSGKKRIKKSRSFPDKNGKAAVHIINFEEGGFVILSADKRTEALLAFSDKNTFELKSNTAAPGPNAWLSMISEGISGIRSGEYKSEGFKTKYQDSWEMAEIENAMSDRKTSEFSKTIDLSATDCYYPGYPPGCTSICQDTYYTRGPLLRTQWGQAAGFNDLLPHKGCSAHGYNGRPPAGCSAVAMAQVMRYHRQPSSRYNFAAMPLGRNGSNETSRLIRDIGSTVKMKYGCNNSWLWPWVMDGAFGYYSYGGAIYEKYDTGDHNIVKSNLGKNQPVLLMGKDKPLVDFISGDQTFHIWVCDGYRTRYDCQNGIGYLYFHMNWGWNGTNDGWFGFQNWLLDGADLKYYQYIVHNIKP